jgi:LuxR family transcriptional regulator, maltose regulon positive regulatory protein
MTGNPPTSEACRADLTDAKGHTMSAMPEPILISTPDRAEAPIGTLEFFDEAATSAIALSEESVMVEPWVTSLRACMMREGAEQALADAELTLEGLASGSAGRPAALVMRGTAHELLAEPARARDDFTAAVEMGLALGAMADVFVAQAQLALLAARQGSWEQAGQRARVAEAIVQEMGFGDYSTSVLADVATARVALREARQDDARAALKRAHRARPLLDHGLPWLAVKVGLELIRAHLALAEAGTARTVLAETERVLELRPRMGLLAEDARELRDCVDATSGPGGTWAMSLSGAELRLLPYLATHLTFQEIASRLFISRNTVKTEAVATYRKLSVSSRSEAVERAVDLGLLESSVYPPQIGLVQR